MYSVILLFRGYHGDLNETLFVGEVSEKSRNLVVNTWECLEKAITECVKPGTKYREVSGQRVSNGVFTCIRRLGMLYRNTPQVGDTAWSGPTAATAYTSRIFSSVGCWSNLFV